MCVEDPRRNLPNAHLYGIQDMMRADMERLFATNHGSTDIERYSKEFESNNLQLTKRILKKRGNIPVVVPAQENMGDLFKEISLQSMPPEEIARRALSSARLSALPSDVTVEQLTNRAQKWFQRKHYANALRNFSFSIDKLLLEKPIYKMETVEQICLAKLYCKRAECNLELAKQHRSERIADKVLDDYAFVMQIGVFKTSIIEDELDLCANFR